MDTFLSETEQRMLNSELEELRALGLGSATVNKIDIVEMTCLTKGLHAAWLFHPWGRQALQSLCQSLSSLAPNKDGSWYHFAGVLKIPWEQIECIYNDKSERDKSELCLMTFAQLSDATLDQIIVTLESIERFDALSKLQLPLTLLVKVVKSKLDHEQKDDKGSIIHSNDYGDLSSTIPVENIVIRPKGFDKLKFHLPIALRNLQSSAEQIEVTTKQLKGSIPAKEDVNYQQSNQTDIIKPPAVPYKKTVLLTFAEDGQDAAQRIASTLRTPKTDRLPIGVLLLDEHADKLHSNPELLIPTLFNQVDYVMPIITKRYLELLKNFEANTSPPMDMFSSLDVRHVQYIFDLMAKYYTRNACRNNKFRCVIVDGDENEQISLVNSELFRNQLPLRIWVYEADLEKLARLLAGSKHNLKES